jgi:SHS2 domain-containing protein
MFELVHHTADVRFRVTSPTLDGLFADALRALTSFLQPEWAGESAEATIELESADATALLVDFLGEILTRSHVAREAYTEVAFDQLSPTHVRATVRGQRVRGFEEDVKAVTYHEAEVIFDGTAWSTMLVFDI